ncbi:MAG TPA: response regulator [Thermoanaerobaculia bacterium]|nr:response regulator [Thermoanaerobaculia bacterium]
MLPKALVVEDDAATREALRRIVRDEGFEVDAVADGEHALELIFAQRYAVVVLDIVLPGMSGAEVMEELLATSPDILESIVVVTGLDVSEIRKLYPGVREALGKPVFPARLRKAVRRFLPGSDEASGIIVA